MEALEHTLNKIDEMKAKVIRRRSGPSKPRPVGVDHPPARDVTRRNATGARRRRFHDHRQDEGRGLRHGPQGEHRSDLRRLALSAAGRRDADTHRVHCARAADGQSSAADVRSRRVAHVESHFPVCFVMYACLLHAFTC